MKIILKKLKKVLSYIIVVVLTILITTCIYLSILNNTILNKDNILTMIDNSSYYTRVKNETLNLLEGYIQQSGFDKTILESAITEDIIKEDIHNIINGIYTNTKISSSDVTLNLQNNIDKYIKDNNKVLDIAQKNSIKELITLMSNEYNNNIFPSIGIPYLSDAIKVASNYYLTINNYVIITTIILIVILILLSFKNSILYLSIALLSTSFLILSIYLYTYITLDLSNISIHSESITTMINLIISSISSKVYTYSFIIFIISIIVCYLSCFKKFKK